MHQQFISRLLRQTVADNERLFAIYIFTHMTRSNDLHDRYQKRFAPPRVVSKPSKVSRLHPPPNDLQSVGTRGPAALRVPIRSSLPSHLFTSIAKVSIFFAQKNHIDQNILAEYSGLDIHPF